MQPCLLEKPSPILCGISQPNPIPAWPVLDLSNNLYNLVHAYVWSSCDDAMAWPKLAKTFNYILVSYLTISV